MILLKKVRLINWYAFSNVTAPIGFFTLIAGKNGNGKSVLLDAMKYAAYGDTVFNKSSESKGSRTLSSYTRGLLDATAGTYMRPADKLPNVYSHIALEYWDEAEEKSFVLGAVIETNAANNIQTLRYVLENRTLDEVEHTTTEDGVICPMPASAFQKKYQVQLLNREQGLLRFMQMTGLKLGISQIPTYLRKLRGIMSYDPDAKIDRFIRESVLEERNVDFAKLIEAKENIERLRDMFRSIQGEITDLDGILEKYDHYENEKNRLLADDIRIVYKKKTTLKTEIGQLTQKQALFRRQKEEVKRELKLLERQLGNMEEQLLQARVSLQQSDSERMIAEETRKLAGLREQEERLRVKKNDLELFERKVSEMLADLMQDGGQLAEKEILASLCGSSHSVLEKQNAVAALEKQVEKAYEKQVEAGILLRGQKRELEKELTVQEQILDACQKHRNAYSQIPEYLNLREEINREFAKRQIPSEAKFACEYVIGLKDESWRNAVEAFLGARRYTILVEPAYYDIAYELQNRSNYRYAHLFNTKLLMRKDVDVQEDSVVHILDIKNPVAQKYFAYQLGRMHAAALSEVKDYENAISREGRVSVAMDSYFLRFDRIRFYYLGQETFELNRRAAEKAIAALKEQREALFVQLENADTKKNALAQDKTFFRAYDYDAPREYERVRKQVQDSEAQLQKLVQAQKNNSEFIELNRLVTRLSNERATLRDRQKEKNEESANLKSELQSCADKLERKTNECKEAEKEYREFETTAYTLVQKTVAAYEKYLANGETGVGGLLKSRERAIQQANQYKNELLQLQFGYRSRHLGSALPVGVQGRELYAAQKDRIWMDDLQEVRTKLEEQTKRYEDIFKNEFVLTILKSCEKARDDLKEINRELNKLKFSAKYEFDIHYVKDGSDYAKILEYARFLDEREKLGNSGPDGQMTLGMTTTISDEEGAQLEQELKQIISRIIAKNSEETIVRFADYRNYMTYEILISNGILNRAKLSRQTGFNSGAEVQIPYLLILSAALLLIYNQRINSTRLVFIDEPFAKMDPGNVKIMLDFMRRQNMQVIFCSPDKTDSIGSECEVVLPVLRVRADNMQLGIVRFHETDKR